MQEEREGLAGDQAGVDRAIVRDAMPLRSASPSPARWMMSCASRIGLARFDRQRLVICLHRVSGS